jgi:hypothetical protein
LTALTEGHFNLRDFGGGCPDEVRTASQVFVVKNYPIAFGLDDEAGAQKFSSWFCQHCTSSLETWTTWVIEASNCIAACNAFRQKAICCIGLIIGMKF